MRLLLCCLLLGQVAMGQFADDPRYIKKRAERYMARFNYERALTYLKDAARRLPKDGEIRVLMGECYFALSRWPEAARAFRSGVAVDPALVGCVSHLPLALIRSNRLDDAQKEAALLAEKGRNERTKANGYFSLGLVAWHRGQSALAEKHFKNALRHDPTMPKAHYRLGLVQMRLGHLEQAVASLGRVMELDTLHQAAAHNLALACRRLGRLNEARAWRDRHREIAGVLAEISQLKRSLQEKPDQIALIRRLADIYFKFQRFQEAAAPYSACVAAAPTEAEPRYLYARCLFETGDYHRARLQLNQVLARHPDCREADVLQKRIRAMMGVEKEQTK